LVRNQILENPRWRIAAILDFDFGPIWSSINIFAPNLVPRWKINGVMRPIAQKSNFGKSKMADEFRYWAVIWASINIFAPNSVRRWKSNCSEAHWSKIRFSDRPIQDGGRLQS